MLTGGGGLSRLEGPAAPAGRLGTLDVDEQGVDDVEPLVQLGLRGLARKQEVTSRIKERVEESDFKFMSIPRSREKLGPTVGGVDAIDAVNFLFGDEMAVLGAQLDNDGFNWDWENAKHQWAEEPMWSNLLATASLVGTVAFPAMKSLKFGKAGELLGKFGDRATEITKFKSLGAFENVADSEVTNTMLRKARRLELSRTKQIEFMDKLAKAEKGELQIGPIERAKFEFDKRFANQYFKNMTHVSERGTLRKEYADSLHRFWANENLGRFFTQLPGEERGIAVKAYLIQRANPDMDLKALAKSVDPNFDLNTLKLNPEEQAWADNLYKGLADHQQEAVADGLISEVTKQTIGDIHIAALRKGTPLPEAKATSTFLLPVRGARTRTLKGVDEAGEEVETKYIAYRTFEFPRLDAPQMRHRKSDMGEIAERLFKGELITDPADLTFRSFVTDRMLLQNYKFTRDLIMTQGRNHADVLATYGNLTGAEKAGWVSLNKLGGEIPNTLKRMLEKKGYTMDADGNLPFIHESVFKALFGDDGMFSQAQSAVNVIDGMVALHKTMKTVFSVPTHLQNFWGNVAFLAQAGFNPFSRQNVDIMHQSTKAFKNWAEVYRSAKASGISPRDAIKNVNLGKMKIGKKVFDLNDELLDPLVRDIVEESAFVNVEGFGVIEELMQNTQKGGFTRAMLKSVLKIRDLNKFTRKSFDTMNAAYLGEDMVPKVSYYMSLRAKGFSREWAALEVGRRLPMYATTGSTIRGARRFVFPWASFPTEALRIFKNNMQDDPIRMLPWMHLPSLMQTGMSMFGGGPATPQEAAERSRQLPVWAQGPMTLLQQGPAGAAMGAGIAGAGTGAFLGGAMGGFAGAVAGGAAGAGIMGAMPMIEGSLLDEERNTSNQVRGAVMNWIPHSAFLPQGGAFSPDFNWNDPQAILEAMPAEPLAILKPIVELSMGKTAYGQEIGSEGPADFLGKTVAGYVGLLSPPWMQRYGFRTATPDQPLSDEMLGMHIPGDVTNVSRLLIESGLNKDPATGKPGSPTFDMIINNGLGLWRSYSANPEAQLINEGRQEMALSELRTYLSKNLSYHVANGNDKLAGDILYKVYTSYARQYAADPGMAQEKFKEWTLSRIKDFGRHPQLRNWSEEDLIRRFSQVSDITKGIRTQARRDLLTFLKTQLTLRRASQQR